MSDPRLGAPDGEPTWKALPKSRPWYRNFAAHRLAESEVRAPDGSTYGVRVVSDSPVTGLTKIASLPANPLGVAADLIKTNLVRSESGGWTIEVVKPATRWRSERVLFAQPVGAAAIVVDVTVAITNAIQRGDKLWPDDEDY